MKIPRLTVLPVGQMQANCYVYTCTDAQTCVIIDPGDDADYISDTILRLGVTPVAIIATHGHFDHIMAACDLQLMYGIPFFLHAKDHFLLTRMQESAQHFLGIQLNSPKPKPENEFSQKRIDALGIDLTIIETPGHTPGSVCLWNAKESFICTGDLLFSGGAVGRTDFAYSDPVVLRESLKNICGYPGETILYPGHGEASRIQAECRRVLPL